MPTTSSAYSPQAAQGTETPPFGAQENFYEIYGGSSGNELVKPQVEAKIEKGFFFSGDNCWTCYRRNYFAVQCSYTLTPHLSNQIHMLHHNGEHKQIQAMAMSLSARVNGTVGKPIELVQHTPKRDKGPQNPIKLTKLCPIPPGGKLGHLPHAESHFGHGLMGSYGSTSHIAAPYFPLQSQPDPDASQHDSGSPHSTPPTTPTAHQHTFERIQFKSATANNGKRRAQQQYYHLVVELHADIRAPNAQNAKWVKVAERVSSRVVVRGRSPSHYSNEGPNSTANRGGGAGAPGAGGYHGLGGSLSGTFGGSGFGNRSLSNYSLQNGVYRGNQYTMDPTPMSSHTVSSSSSVAGEPVDTFSMDHSSSMILTSQGGPDRLDFMQPPMTGLGLPPIFGSTLPRVKDESYFMSNRIPPVEISAVYWMTSLVPMLRALVILGRFAWHVLFTHASFQYLLLNTDTPLRSCS
jgi:meiosis-specific transcription factor NDT80